MDLKRMVRYRGKIGVSRQSMGAIRHAAASFSG